MGMGTLGPNARLPGSMASQPPNGEAAARGDPDNGRNAKGTIESFWDAYKTRQKGQNWGSPGHEEVPCPMVGQGKGRLRGRKSRGGFP